MLAVVPASMGTAHLLISHAKIPSHCLTVGLGTRKMSEGVEVLVFRRGGHKNVLPRSDGEVQMAAEASSPADIIPL